jgi:hypothetical protein
MKNQWSANAAALAVIVTLMLVPINDLPLTIFVALFCPAPLILVRALTLFGLSFPQWMLIALVPAGATGNALWYMLVTETFRLLILRLRSKFGHER